MEELTFKSLADRWPSTFVARERIGDLTGGVLSSGYCANLDSQGRGIAGRIRVGRKICYPVVNVVSFLESRKKKL